MRFKKTTLVLTAIVLCLTALTYSWPTSCPTGSIKLWTELYVSASYPSQWYADMFFACMDDASLAGISSTVLMETSWWSSEGYTWAASCCEYLS